MTDYFLQPIIALAIISIFGLAAWLVPKFTFRDKDERQSKPEVEHK